MTWELLLEAALKSIAVSALALLLLQLANGRSAAERAWIAHVGVLLAVLAPPIALWGPNLEAPWLPAVSGASSESAGFPFNPSVIAGEAMELRASQDLNVSGLTLLAAAYGLIAGLLLLGLASSVARLLMLQRNAQVLTAQPWLSALAHAQQRMGFKHGAALLISDDVASPVSWGLFRPTIVLNRAAVEAPHQAEAVIAHELAHVIRLDWANLMLARLSAALLWFNPLIWILAREAHQLREEAADDAVLRGDVPGPDYASLLLGVARLENRGALLAAHGMAPGRDSLKRRLVRVLDADLPRGPARRGWRACATVSAFLLAGPLAALTPVAARDHAVPGPRRPVEASSITETTSALERRVPPEPIDGAAAVAVPAPVQTDAAIETRISAPLVSAAAPLPVPAPAPVPVSAPDPPASIRPTPVETGQLSPELLTQMRAHRVTPGWIASVQAEYPILGQAAPQQLIGLAVLGVRPEWLRKLKAVGYRDLTVEQITSLAAHKVSADYVRELAAAGYRDLSANQLLSMRIHGVNAAYIRDLQGDIRTRTARTAEPGAEAKLPPPRSLPPPGPPSQRSLPPPGLPPPISVTTRF